jgi:hypothetical protein
VHNVQRIIIGSILIVPLFSACVSLQPYLSSEEIPAEPDYSKSRFWAALPNKADSADLTPQENIPDLQQHAEADVFFLHPTTYTNKKASHGWNASIFDSLLNRKTDRTTIRHQASIFNGAGQVYAPRYRQVHLEAFYTKKKKQEADRGLQLAYEDIRNAFEYYLETYNKGNPIIIAAHSQGTYHAGRLLKEFFDGKHLKEKLIVAYLVGMPVPRDHFETIPLCEYPEQTGCFCSWRSYKKGFYPRRWYSPNAGIGVTNPLSWTTDTDYVPRSNNLGAVLRHFHKGIIPEFIDAQVHDGMLWTSKPDIPFKIFLRNKNYHIADYNFFYMNVRKNAIERKKAYFDAK